MRIRAIWNKLNDVFSLTVVHPQYFIKITDHKFLKEVQKVVHGTFLDIGCGRQWYRGQIEPLVKKYYGLDHPQMSKHYGSDFPIELKADVSAIPLVRNTADVVMMNDVLELVPDPNKALQEIHRVLKNKGLLLTWTVENYPAHGFPDTYYRWTKLGLMELFKKNNFQIKKIISFGNFWETQAIFQNVYLMNSIKSLLFDRRLFLFGAISLLICFPFMILGNFFALVLGRGKATGDFTLSHITICVAKK